MGWRATATFLPALVDADWVPVVITYADGATDRLAVQNMIEMGGPSVWRMSIGADINHDPRPSWTVSGHAELRRRQLDDRVPGRLVLALQLGYAAGL